MNIQPYHHELVKTKRPTWLTKGELCYNESESRDANEELSGIANFYDICPGGNYEYADRLGDFWFTYSLAGMHYLVAQTLAYACGMINSYVLNKSWTFKVKNKANPVETGKFLAVNLICLCLSYLLLYGWNSFVGEYMLIGKAVVTAVLMVLNYLLNKQWVFKTNEESVNIQNDWE
ncbi:GtrA family protein [Paenibacillus larvae]|nr:GtrA family protein [Paenibacillus larvae]MDT2255554.1 GtrA family protein [Paenibacillus larvae]